MSIQKSNYLYSKKIIVVDDEKEILQMLRLILEEEGFTDITCENSFANALHRLQSEQYDLGIFDVMLGDGDGFSLLKAVRRQSDLPVIFLTAREDGIDRISGLSLGADDYITKPFLPQELILRIMAVLRRIYKEENHLLQLEHTTVDLSTAEVKKGDETLRLTAKEHAILEVLARNEGKIVTIDALCEALWGDNPYGYENSLNAHIRRLREKIEEQPSKPVSLITVKGLGYKLNTQLSHVL